MLRSIIVGVGVLLISTAVQAADHWQRCKQAFEAGTAITAKTLPEPTIELDPGDAEAWCFDTNASGGDLPKSSPMISARGCEYLDVQVYSPDGGDPSNIAVSFFLCDAPDTTNCVAVDGIDNEVTTWPNSFSTQYGYVQLTQNAAGDDVRTLVQCFDGQSRKKP